MPAGIREPDLPAFYRGPLQQTITSLQDTLQRLGEDRDARVDRITYSQPSEQFALLLDLARRVCTLANEYKNGQRVRDGSEPSGWQGSAGAGADEALIAKFAAGCTQREAVARAAAAQYDELSGKCLVGISGMTKARFVRAAVAAAQGGGSFRG